MSVERRGPAVCDGFNNMGGKREMTKAPSSLQDLRRSLYVKAKAEPTWRFWGLYVHVCKKETLDEAYRMAKENDGAPGIDGVTFEAIEESGVEGFLEQIRDELVSNTYRPMRARKKQIPKDGESRSRPSRKAERRVFWSRYEMNWSQTRIGPCGHGRRKFPRMGSHVRGHRGKRSGVFSGADTR